MLAATGKAVLANENGYGAYLDAMTIGRERARFTVDQLRNRLDENRTVATKTDEPQTRHEPNPGQQPGFARSLDDDRQPRNPPRSADEGERQGFDNTSLTIPRNSASGAKEPRSATASSAARAKVPGLEHVTTIRLTGPRDIIDHALQVGQHDSMTVVTVNLAEFKTTVAEFVDALARP